MTPARPKYFPTFRLLLSYLRAIFIISIGALILGLLMVIELVGSILANDRGSK